jgi:hypothetical protein
MAHDKNEAGRCQPTGLRIPNLNTNGTENIAPSGPPQAPAPAIRCDSVTPKRSSASLGPKAFVGSGSKPATHIGHIWPDRFAWNNMATHGMSLIAAPKVIRRGEILPRKRRRRILSIVSRAGRALAGAKSFRTTLPASTSTPSGPLFSKLKLAQNAEAYVAESEKPQRVWEAFASEIPTRCAPR